MKPMDRFMCHFMMGSPSTACTDMKASTTLELHPSKFLTNVHSTALDAADMAGFRIKAD